MGIIDGKSPNPPYSDDFVDDKGKLARAWHAFFGRISEALAFLGQEKVQPLINNSLGPAVSITGLKFDYRYTSGAIIEYLVQRVTDSVELLQIGRVEVCWRPTAEIWACCNTWLGPDDVEITFSIGTDGQVKYNLTNIAGTESISRIIYRVRPFAGKSSLYSKVG